MDARASTVAVDFTAVPAFTVVAELERVALVMWDMGQLVGSTAER
jgi:hypothetical protein